MVKLALRCGADVDGVPSMASTAVREKGARLLLLACREDSKNLKAAVTCLLEAKERVAGGQESALEDAVKVQRTSCLTAFFFLLLLRSLSRFFWPWSEFDVGHAFDF